MLKQQELPDITTELYNNQTQMKNSKDKTMLSSLLDKTAGNLEKTAEVNKTVSRIESQMRNKSELMTVIDDTVNTSNLYDGPGLANYQVSYEYPQN